MIIRKLYYVFLMIGIDIKVMFSMIRYLPGFLRDYFKLKKQLRAASDFSFGRFYPILTDKYDSSGQMKGAYFHQDLLVAQKIHQDKPSLHVDIGSRTDGFVAHVACFRKIEVLDIRSNHSPDPNITFKQADLMQLPDDMEAYCDSISSLHAIEHFGLGRYGDPIDANGYLKAIDNIHKILKPNGKFYFSVPIGPQRIEFNAHRVFSVDYLVSILTEKFQVMEFSYVDDAGELYRNVDYKSADAQKNFGCRFGCGIFVLTKA